MSHVQLVAGDDDVRAHEPARRFANRRERFRQDLVEDVGDLLAQFAFRAAAPVAAVQLGVDALALRRVGRHALRGLQFLDARLDRADALRQHGAELGRLRLDLLVGQRGEAFLERNDFVDDRLHATTFALVSRPEQAANDFV